MNIGLLLPIQVVDAAIYYAKNNHVSLNSLEGFIRQIIGWREFIRGVYIYKGTQERTQNYWNFSNSLPEFFYQANSGINPLDSTLKKIFKTGYAHHIERLMVTGNFMLLCEIHPDEVYRWYMEMFIDAYDWVMVPNVYGMSQFSDGGLMATKPYISGSNYLMKMSDFEKGEWQKIWDALFWRFMFIHRDFFLKNPRLGMLVRTFDKMDETKRNLHLKTAEDYLTGL
jgi:deoxyribodipyrimidine photolyase-related protein